MNKTAVKRRSPEDAKRIRSHAQLACAAIEELVAGGVTVLAVAFALRRPRIEVAYAGACRKMESCTIRYGVDGSGSRYRRKAALFCECQVEWVEIVSDRRVH